MKMHFAAAAAAISFGFMLLFGSASPGHAQMSEFASASLLAIEHVDMVVTRVSDKAYASSGRLSGKLVANLVGAQGGPAINFQYVCSSSAEIADLKNGVFPKKTGDCTFKDRDGNAIFTMSQCSLRSRDDWCVGTISGGSGKFAGIAGTIRFRNPAPGKFTRTCIAAPNQDNCESQYANPRAVPVGTSYRIQGDWAVPYEWEWTIQ